MPAGPSSGPLGIGGVPAGRLLTAPAAPAAGGGAAAPAAGRTGGGTVTVGMGGGLPLPAAGVGVAGGLAAAPALVPVGVLTLGAATAGVPARAGTMSEPLPAAGVPALPCAVASLPLAPESPEQPLTAAMTQASAHGCMLSIFDIARPLIVTRDPTGEVSIKRMDPMGAPDAGHGKRSRNAGCPGAGAQGVQRRCSPLPRRTRRANVAREAHPWACIMHRCPRDPAWQRRHSPFRISGTFSSE